MSDAGDRYVTPAGLMAHIYPPLPSVTLTLPLYQSTCFVPRRVVDQPTAPPRWSSWLQRRGQSPSRLGPLSARLVRPLPSRSQTDSCSSPCLLVRTSAPDLRRPSPCSDDENPETKSRAPTTLAPLPEAHHLPSSPPSLRSCPSRAPFLTQAGSP